MAVALLLVAAVASAGFVNPGTPSGIPPSFDCAARKHAWEFGKQTLPQRGSFRTLFDALQLQACGVAPPGEMDRWTAPNLPTPSGAATYFVDAKAGPGGDGSVAKPFRTIHEAVEAARGKEGATVVLRGGTHFVGEQVKLTSEHSGLTIENYRGEEAVVSGGVAIENDVGKWTPYKVTPLHWATYQNQNNVYGVAQSRNDTDSTKYVGDFPTFDDCKSAAEKSAKGPFKSITWHSPSFGGDFSKQCFGVVTTYWIPYAQDNVVSARMVQQNTWKLDVSGLKLKTQLLGLRVDGGRAVRAKYPDGNPELSGEWFVSSDPGMGNGKYAEGWITTPTTWLLPHNADARWNGTQDIVTNGKAWPGVNWPATQEGGSSWTGEGDWGDYHIGGGGDGFCNDISPPYGYWCSQRPPRGQCYDPKTKTSAGCTQTHMAPGGVKYEGPLPHAVNYSNPAGAVVQVWRGGGRWFTNLCLVSGMNKEDGTMTFDPKIGCNQGGEGSPGGNEWWIENVKEECDAPGEWFHDVDEGMLYYTFNGTEKPSGKEELVGVVTKVLFNLTGSMSRPVERVTLRGLVVRDAALTYLGTDVADIHGMPSGGDWGLQKSGAILLDGTEQVTIDQCLFTRLDGNGIFLKDYNRNTTISNNEMSWIGDSAMAAWGSTGYCLDADCKTKLSAAVGPDGRAGNHPMYTHVVGNLVREIGIWQKQSSMWFQAITARTHLERNVHFNGPRAGLNFNDGFAGGDVIEGNLLANCVRESGDHGPWNSWDRIPYITNMGMVRDTSVPRVGDGLPGHRMAGGPSVVPRFREIRHNFIISVYSSQEAIDTDDGSSYYQTHDNYFVYASAGLKSDFGGQWNHHFRNVYAYVGTCFGTGQNLAFYNNLCQTKRDSGYASTCHNPPATMTITGNEVHSPTGSTTTCAGDNSTVAKYLSDDELTARGAAALKPFPRSS